VPEPKEGLFRYPVVIAFMAIIAAIEFIRMSLFITFLPSFMTSLHFTTVAIGLIISVNLFTDNLSKSAVGWLVDHRGPWPVLLAGSITTLIGILLIIYFHENLFFLTIAAVFIGLGVAPTWPAAISGSIQTVGEEKRATIISVISVVWLSGGGLGPVLMGFLIDTRMRKFLTKVGARLFDRPDHPFGGGGFGGDYLYFRFHQLAPDTPFAYRQPESGNRRKKDSPAPRYFKTFMENQRTGPGNAGANPFAGNVDAQSAALRYRYHRSIRSPI
jgi:MFS family permease